MSPIEAQEKAKKAKARLLKKRIVNDEMINETHALARIMRAIWRIDASSSSVSLEGDDAISEDKSWYAASRSE